MITEKMAKIKEAGFKFLSVISRTIVLWYKVGKQEWYYHKE